MTNPAASRSDDRPDDPDPYPSNPADRMPDPGKETYFAYDDPDEALRNSSADRTDGVSVFELDGGDEMPDAVQEQPPPSGVGPISGQFLFLVLLVIVIIGVFVLLALVI